MRASALFLVAAVASCTPYERHSGEYYAGAVDPAGFPAAYLGAGGDPKRSGGVIVASAATAHDLPAPYYAFALSTAQAGADDPTVLAAPPPAYVFDARCTPPPGYAYDARRDGYRLDEQGNVFSALPKAGYAPVVAEVPVTSNGEPCQSIKSKATLLSAPDVVAGMPDGRLLAWAIVDPGAEVRGPEKIGWFDHYLLTYLDGGEAPASAVDGGVRVVPQNVYFPRPGKLGDGFDILDAARGEAGYSPLCHVYSFAPADPLHPPTSAADIDPTSLEDTGAFVWCLQVQP